jgi:hypothetical protein
MAAILVLLVALAAIILVVLLVALVATTRKGVAALQTPARALTLANRKDWIHDDVSTKELSTTAVSSTQSTISE